LGVGADVESLFQQIPDQNISGKILTQGPCQVTSTGIGSLCVRRIAVCGNEFHYLSFAALY
jgi:hypothetical protein